MVYDDAANTVTAIDGNGHATTSTFDLEGRLVQVVNPVGGTKVFDYDDAGNKTLESSVFDGATPRFDTHFIYDEAGRLTRRNEPEGRTTTYDVRRRRQRRPGDAVRIPAIRSSRRASPPTSTTS